MDEEEDPYMDITSFLEVNVSDETLSQRRTPVRQNALPRGKAQNGRGMGHFPGNPSLYQAMPRSNGAVRANVRGAQLMNGQPLRQQPRFANHARAQVRAVNGHYQTMQQGGLPNGQIWRQAVRPGPTHSLPNPVYGRGIATRGRGHAMRPMRPASQGGYFGQGRARIHGQASRQMRPGLMMPPVLNRGLPRGRMNNTGAARGQVNNTGGPRGLIFQYPAISLTPIPSNINSLVHGTNRAITLTPIASSAMQRVLPKSQDIRTNPMYQGNANKRKADGTFANGLKIPDGITLTKIAPQAKVNLSKVKRERCVPPKLSYTCEICSQALLTQYRLKLHLKSHATDFVGLPPRKSHRIISPNRTVRYEILLESDDIEDIVARRDTIEVKESVICQHRLFEGICPTIALILLERIEETTPSNNTTATLNNTRLRKIYSEPDKPKKVIFDIESESEDEQPDVDFVDLSKKSYQPEETAEETDPLSVSPTALDALVVSPTNNDSYEQLVSELEASGNTALALTAEGTSPNPSIENEDKEVAGNSSPEPDASDPYPSVIADSSLPTPDVALPVTSTNLTLSETAGLNLNLNTDPYVCSDQKVLLSAAGLSAEFDVGPPTSDTSSAKAMDSFPSNSTDTDPVVDDFTSSSPLDSIPKIKASADFAEAPKCSELVTSFPATIPDTSLTNTTDALRGADLPGFNRSDVSGATNANPEVQKVHSDSGALMDSGEIDFTCNKCLVHFTDLSQLYTHVMNPCQVCGLKFCSTDALLTHHKTHITEWHACAVCNQRFLTLDLLIEHLQIHLEVD